MLGREPAPTYAVSVLGPDCDDGDASRAQSCGHQNDIAFENEELITILGYSGDAMEVDITFDGQMLMFNDRVLVVPHKNIHWASRIDDVTFQYEGEVEGINSTQVDSTPSFDEIGNVYYTSLVTCFDTDPDLRYKSVFKGLVEDGVLVRSELLENIYVGQNGWISLDPDVSSNGRFLFYTQNSFDPMNPSFAVTTWNVRGAERDDDGGFAPVDDATFDDINTDAFEYAPTISNDGLEMYFTRADISLGGILGIYKATRESIDEPFQAVDIPVAAITGVVEAPAFNGDETALYYHREVDGVFKIFRVTRTLP